MSDGLPLDRAVFAALWVESVLYGVYTMLFSACIYVLLHAKRRPGVGPNKPLLATAIIIFSLCTIHVSVAFARGIIGFVDGQNVPHGAEEYYTKISLWLNIFKQALYATNNIVADGLVIYRCYIVWNYSRWIIVGPIVMLLATTVCAYLAVYNFSQVVSGADVFAFNIAQWGTALFAISLATNITVTSLIAGRIWWLSRETAVLGVKHLRKYHRAIAIIIESGAIYSVSLLILLVLYCLQSNAQYIAYDALSQIMGIVPTLIIVRVGLGISTQDANTYATSGDANVLSTFEASSSNRKGAGGSAGLRFLKPRRTDTSTGSDTIRLGDLNEDEPHRTVVGITKVKEVVSDNDSVYRV